MTELSPRTYGLLIGINHYQPNRFYKDLRGCVRDINLVDAYLQQSLQLEPENIRRLTSSTPEEIALSQIRDGQLDPEPTYENIVRAFAEITQTARTGDRIYIHYCGHGGRVITQYPELKGENQTDEGLVPSDFATSRRYIRDIEMTTLLKRMVEKGLIVTLVLDSCHSGGATRGDCAIRGSNETDTQLSETESLVGTREELIANWQSLTEGNQKKSWLPGSQDYVLLAACRPTEYAFEYAVTGKERYGALTYWMVDTLNTLGNQISYKTLYDRVSAKIQSKFPAQLPMLVGDAERTLFKGDRQSTQYTATVLGISDGLVTISAAMPQGISEGVRFAIYPLNCEDLSDRSRQQAIIEIIEVETARSIGRILSVEEGGLPLQENTAEQVIEQGAPAVMLSTPADLKRRVRLYDQKQVGTQEHELPPEMVEKQAPALEAVRKALADNGWIVEVEGDRAESHYQVSINAAGEYEICIGMPLANLTPALSIEDPSAPQKVVDRLVHLAKYQAVQELDNPASELTASISCQILNRAKQPIAAAAPLTVKPGERLYLRMQNTSDEALNVAVLDVEPTWAISQISLKGLTAPFYQLAKGEVLDTPLGFVLPDTENYQQSKEVLKVFATRGPADFRWLHLPSLDEDVNARATDLTRSNSAFSKLLEAVGGDSGAKPSITRAIVYDPDPGAEWVTQQIPLLVTRE